MPTYSVEGKLGTGKSKFCVWMAQNALREGRQVASNLDLDMEKLLPGKRRTYLRVPDKPTAADLMAIGHGNPDSYDEGKNGLLILDELGTWLNSRSFQDKDRAGMLDWLIHARKYGWDVYLIVQDAAMIDKQVRVALIEYQCKCMRMDKVRIPFVGWLIGALHSKWGYLPRFHIVTARVGEGQGAVTAERWYYRGDDLHAAYDTRQVFRSDYDKGTYSTLPATPAPARRSLLARLASALAASPPARPPLRAKHPTVARIVLADPDNAWRHVQRLTRRSLI